MRRLVKRLHRWLRRRDGPAILMYHRIATPDVDPWGLSVSPERFAEQVHALRARRTILSMDAFVARLQSGDLPHDAVALTFDDGYLDNLRQAKPILEAAEIPATVFLTTGRIGTGKEFWWDELARMVLSRAEPLSASVKVEADEPADRSSAHRPGDGAARRLASLGPASDRPGSDLPSALAGPAGLRAGASRGGHGGIAPALRLHPPKSRGPADERRRRS